MSVKYSELSEERKAKIRANSKRWRQNNKQQWSKIVSSWLRRNKEKRDEWNKRWRENNRDKLRMYRLSRTAKNHGLTLQEWMAMLAAQEYGCAICRSTSAILCVDHNHKTNHNRGLLCHRCNRAIGLLGDSTETLERAIAYLRG